MLRNFALPPPLALLLPLLLGCAAPTSPETAARVAEESLPETPDEFRFSEDSNPGSVDSGLVDAGLVDVSPVETGWIERLGDPALTTLVREAQENNRDLQAAAASVDRAWALAGQAGAGLSPQVSLGSASSRTGSGDGRSLGANATSPRAGWELDIWGRLAASAQAGVLSAQAAEADYAFSRYSIAAAVARAYFLAIDAGRQVEIVAASVDSLTEIVRIVDVQFEFGLVTSQEVLLSRSDLASARANLVAARGARRDALRALEALIGRYPSAEVDVSAELPGLPRPPPPGIPSQLLERRPDIVAAERRVAAAFNSLDAARAARLPSVALTGELGGASADLLDFLNPSNLAWMAAVNLTSPLIDGGLAQSQIDQAGADQQRAIAEYGQTVLDAFREVEAGLDQLSVLEDQVGSILVAAESAGDALRISRLRYEEGETDLLEVLTIQQRLFSAEADLSSLQRARLDSWVHLNLALGGDWE